MEAKQYMDIKQWLINEGYDGEIDWQTNLQPCKSAYDFHGETCWVILNSGMKEQIARQIWNKIKDAWASGIDIAEVFKHKGKVAAIKLVTETYEKLFENYQNAGNKIEYLKTIPFIGKITCYHLAKNLGHDCVKPDRHLVRIANDYNMTPDQLCEKISKETGDKKCVVDIVLWRAANLKAI